MIKKAIFTASAFFVVLAAFVSTNLACDSTNNVSSVSNSESDIVVLTQEMTCASPSDIYVVTKGINANNLGGYVTGVIQNTGEGTFNSIQVYAECHYSEAFPRTGFSDTETQTCTVGPIGPGQSANYQVYFSSWVREDYYWDLVVMPISYDVWVEGDYEAHIKGEIKNNSNRKQGYAIDARFYDAQGTLLGEASTGSYYGDELWPGDTADYDIKFTSETKPVRYELYIE